MFTRMFSRKISGLELFVVLGVIVLAALIGLPSLSRAREASRRASCQNNLKQMGIVLKMYANESPGAYAPPLSPILDNWMVDMNAIHPEYLSDLGVLICPQNPFGSPHIFDVSTSTGQRPDPRCVSSLFYIYTGYTIYSDEQAQALFDAYMLNPEAVINGDVLNVLVPEWPESTRITGVPDFHQIPYMWDRVPLGEDEFPHTPAGINVLHFDGHVEFVKYSHYNSSNYFPATRVSADTFGSVLPALPPFCASHRG